MRREHEEFKCQDPAAAAADSDNHIFQAECDGALLQYAPARYSGCGTVRAQAEPRNLGVLLPVTSGVTFQVPRPARARAGPASLIRQRGPDQIRAWRLVRVLAAGENGGSLPVSGTSGRPATQASLSAAAPCSGAS